MSLSMSRDAVPNSNHCIRVGTDRQIPLQWTAGVRKYRTFPEDLPNRSKRSRSGSSRLTKGLLLFARSLRSACDGFTPGRNTPLISETQDIVSPNADRSSGWMLGAAGKG
jgi:hypothetical protein